MKKLRGPGKAVKMCSVSGCKNKYYGKGYCEKHYAQIRKNGYILPSVIYDQNVYIIEGDAVKIECTNKKLEPVGYLIIDVADVEKCKPYRWCISNGYGVNSSKVGRLASFILGIVSTKHKLVDHIDRNPLNNRRNNLRICTAYENGLNKGTHKLNTSGYTGVSGCASKWVSYINADGKRHMLGTFSTKEQAAIAYNEAARVLHGPFAKQNKIILRRRRY